tara:strand:- start:429 stop:1199 length:771 start_codon:yes stop_codon:yes gene_type:complete
MISCLSLGHHGYVGNQMFQYASLMGIAERNKMDYSVLPDYWKQGSFTPHIWEEFSLSAKRTQDHPLHTAREINHCYNPQFQNLSPNTDIFGYFQTEKYFENIKEKVQEEFKFKEETLRECAEYISSVQEGKELVGVHVRRGDYVDLPDYHPVCTKEYYEEAVKRFPDHTFIVVSNDHDWCEENLEMNVFKGSSAFADMCMLTLTQHNIIANSSFSWWGAWLNRNPNKKVIAPTRWFGTALEDKDLSDLIPEGWERI